MHYEDDVPDVRPTFTPEGFTTQSEPRVVVGIFADGDPEAAPLLTLSEQSAHDLAVQLLAHANAMTVDDVVLSLDVGGFPYRPKRRG